MVFLVIFVSLVNIGRPNTSTFNIFVLCCRSRSRSPPTRRSRSRERFGGGGGGRGRGRPPHGGRERAGRF